MKDKDDRAQGNPQFPAGRQQAAALTATRKTPNAVPHSRLQQAANQHAQNIQNPPDFDDDIPFLTDESHETRSGRYQGWRGAPSLPERKNGWLMPWVRW
jgi:hypothetical protein